MPTTPEEHHKKVMQDAMIFRGAFAQTIGFFAIEFAKMERALDCTIHELLGLEPVPGFCVTAAIRNLSTRLDILASLAANLEGVSEGTRKIVSDAVGNAEEINSFRNWVLHDDWSGIVHSSDRPTGYISKRRPRKDKGKFKWQDREFTPDDIADHINRCQAVTHNLQPVLRELSGARVNGRTKADRNAG